MSYIVTLDIIALDMYLFGPFIYGFLLNCILELEALQFFYLQMILKQKLRGQGMAFLVGGGSGTDCFALVTWRNRYWYMRMQWHLHNSNANWTDAKYCAYKMSFIAIKY